MGTILTKEEKDIIGSEARHKTNNHLATLGFDIMEFKKDEALTKQTINYMKDDIKDIKDLLKNFIEEANKKFASKDEHKDNRERIDKINKVFIWVGSIVGSAIIVAILKLIIIDIK